MSQLLLNGRISLAKLVSTQVLHVAWGLGDGAWVVPPAASPSASGLINEVGRRRVDEVGYAAPNDNGSIITPTRAYSRSPDPTSNLYLRVTFQSYEEPTAEIREVGLFMGTVANSQAAASQRYLTPSQIANKGQLLVAQNFVAILRNSLQPEVFQVVLAL